MKHESETLEAVVAARNQAVGASQRAAADPGNAAAMIEPELAQPPLEEFPSGRALRARAAFAFLRFGTKKDVALDRCIALLGKILAGGGDARAVVAHGFSVHAWTAARRSSEIALGAPCRVVTSVAFAKTTT